MLLVFGLRVGLCSPMAPGVVRAPPTELRAGAVPSRLLAHVRFLCDELGPRGTRHPVQMRAAADYIDARFREHGARTWRQPVPVGAPPFENVVARFGPEDAASFIVGAHYDSWMDTVGADDNASGVAGLIELARLLGDLQEPPAVELVAYALEEPPFFRTSAMGSVAHARALTASGAEVKGVMVLEMIGSFRDEVETQQYSSAYLRRRMPSIGNFIAVVGRTDDESLVESTRDAMSVHAGLPVYGYAAPSSVQGIDFSDHRSYWNQGVKAVMVTDTAFLRNSAYHSESDRPETLDYVRMAFVVDGVFSALVAH